MHKKVRQCLSGIILNQRCQHIPIRTAANKVKLMYLQNNDPEKTVSCISPKKPFSGSYFAGTSICLCSAESTKTRFCASLNVTYHSNNHIIGTRMTVSLWQLLLSLEFFYSYSYIPKKITHGTTFIVLHSSFKIPAIYLLMKLQETHA